MRECHRRLLETMYARHREQGECFSGIGDIFLNAATEFQLAYPTYISQLAASERRLNEEIERNGAFRVFLEVRARFSWTYYQLLETDPAVFFLKQRFHHPDNVKKMELRDWLNRPSEHLHRHPVGLEYLRSVTAAGDPEVTFLEKAAEAMRDIQGVAQVKTFQRAMGKGPMGRFEWHNLVPVDVRSQIPKQMVKRQV